MPSFSISISDDMMVKNDAACEKKVLLNTNTHAFKIQLRVGSVTCSSASVRSPDGTGCERSYGVVGLLPNPAHSKSGDSESIAGNPTDFERCRD